LEIMDKMRKSILKIKTGKQIYIRCLFNWR
jgi:hypothetical protein